MNTSPFIGRTLAGRFRITAFIGDGAMASVYRAVQDDEPHDVAVKIARPVARQADGAGARYFTSDCPMAAAQIAHVAESVEPTHPIELLRRAYGI